MAKEVIGVVSAAQTDEGMKQFNGRLKVLEGRDGRLRRSPAAR
jgi:hypothetical protein